MVVAGRVSRVHHFIRVITVTKTLKDQFIFLVNKDGNNYFMLTIVTTLSLNGFRCWEPNYKCCRPVGASVETRSWLRGRRLRGSSSCLGLYVS